MRDIEAKAMRLVMDRRVHIQWRGDDAASGIVDGDTDTYQVSYSPANYVCTCPAGQHYRKCSHSLALELAMAAEREGIVV